eukprot:1805886-Rhodomonas_salina.1
MQMGRSPNALPTLRLIQTCLSPYAWSNPDVYAPPCTSYAVLDIDVSPDAHPTQCPVLTCLVPTHTLLRKPCVHTRRLQ